MNITYIIGLILAFAVMVVGMMFGTDELTQKMTLIPGQITNFADASSVFIDRKSVV